jgi:quercetin 2,3-dioxygenase
MMEIRRSNDRGHADFGWLDSRHSFSFGTYYDAAHMGFSDLRVINQDIVIGGGGFPTHGHRDMEIITYVLRGALSHKDSLGTVETIKAGDVQRMTAGTGIEHSEFNASSTDDVEFLQIWIVPDRAGLEPGYEQISLPVKTGWQKIAEQIGTAETLCVHQDMTLWRGQFSNGADIAIDLTPRRHGWIQIVSGSLAIGSETLHAGDAVALDASTLAHGASECEILFFDLR